MTTITFGKNKGTDARSLARTSRGRDYLAWGVENLESPKWRKEFQAALTEVEIDLNAEADEISREDGLSWEEAYQHAVEEKNFAEGQDEMYRQMNEALDNLKKNLINSGVAVAVVGRVAEIIALGNFEDAIERSHIQFSSKEKEYAIRSSVAQYEIEMGY